MEEFVAECHIKDQTEHSRRTEQHEQNHEKRKPIRAFLGIITFT